EEMNRMLNEGNENPGAFAFRASTAFVLDKFMDDLVLEVGMEKHRPNVLSWNRLESRPRTRDFQRPLRAEVRDALWFLSRQWQMGEFAAEDRGSAVEMRVDIETAKLKRYALKKAAAQPYDTTIPMETLAERESVRPDLHMRAEMGRHWLNLLSEVLTQAGTVSAPDIATVINDFTTDTSFWFSVPVPAEDYPDIHSSPELLNWYASLSLGRAFDGGILLESLTGGSLASSYITSAVPAAVAPLVDDAANQFLAWYQRVYSQPNGSADSAWAASHMEYQFQCSVPEGLNHTILTADEYASGRLDWYSFDIEKSSGKYPASLRTGSNENLVDRKVSTILPGDLQFPGMPMARWWQFEDNQVDIGALRADTSEPGKLLLAEFALIYSNDWMLLPFRVPVGSVSTVKNLVVKDVFGQYTQIQSAGAGDVSDWQRWSMFNLYRRNNLDPQSDQRLFVPPTVVKLLESEPLESVTFLRDEMANMVWGVESIIPDDLGGGKEGWDAGRRLHEFLVSITPAPPPPASANNDAQIAYKLGDSVPEHWIPFIPVRVGGVMSREIQLRRAAMPRLIPGRDPERVRPQTELLRKGYDAGTNT
ncbi:MAG: hypothetical protein AAFV07_16390, partial [Bacteroidota bacterium]